GFIEDITEKLKIQEEKQKIQEEFYHSQKMESIGRLAGGVAHDFNNMLNVIIGYGELALKKLKLEDPLYKDILQILEAAKRANNLVKQLLAFSRKQAMQNEILNVNEVIKNLEKMLKRLIGENIKIELDLINKDIFVYADQSQIEQVLINMAVNSRDAMPNGGIFKISTKDFKLKEEDFVLIEVEDNGTGMDEYVLNHIFEPFFTTKEKGKGTGLGLSTCYGIIKQLGGNIECSSQKGEGTLFKIYLPKTKEKPKEKGNNHSVDLRNIKKGNVLIVEDEEQLKVLLKIMVSNLGFETFIASSGEEALEIIQKEKFLPDLVISDLIMPGMSGLELAEKLKEKFKNIKIIIISGYSDKMDIEKIAKKEYIFFLQKPFTEAQLVKKILEISEL
ncbi:MAG: response regulator, partial [Thermoanaerobaculia bacterium]